MNMVYKHFSFVSKNKDLKYIEKDLEAFGYKNTGRASLHSYEDSIYVNAGEEDWGGIEPKSFWYTYKTPKAKDECRSKTCLEIVHCLSLCKKLLSDEVVSETQKNIQKKLDDMLRYETSTTFNYEGIKFPGLIEKKSTVDIPLPDYVRLSDEDMKKMLDKWIKTLTGELKKTYSTEKDLNCGVYIIDTSKQKTPNKKAQQEGIKEEDGKLNYELDWEFIEAMAQRMQDNKKDKYPPYNWKKPMDIEKLIQAQNRHHVEVMKGNFDDGKEILGHLTAYACNSMMLYWQLKNKK